MSVILNSVKFQRESFVDMFDEAAPLLHKHWQEIAHDKDIPLEVDVDAYRQQEQYGGLRVYTARDSESNRLIGYAAFFVRANPHYKSSIQAVQDVIFVDPERRGMGGALIKYCDEQLKAEGVQKTYHHIKAAHNFGPLLERIGYELVDLIYCRRLDKGDDRG